MINARTNKGADIIDFMADLFHASGQFEHARVPLPLRKEAGEWLADRLWGKPKQTQEVTGADGGAIAVHVGAVAELVASRIVELAPAVRDRLLPGADRPDPSSESEASA